MTHVIQSDQWSEIKMKYTHSHFWVVTYIILYVIYNFNITYYTLKKIDKVHTKFSVVSYISFLHIVYYRKHFNNKNKSLVTFNIIKYNTPWDKCLLWSTRSGIYYFIFVHETHLWTSSWLKNNTFDRVNRKL